MFGLVPPISQGNYFSLSICPRAWVLKLLPMACSGLIWLYWEKWSSFCRRRSTTRLPVRKHSSLEAATLFWILNIKCLWSLLKNTMIHELVGALQGGRWGELPEQQDTLWTSEITCPVYMRLRCPDTFDGNLSIPTEQSFHVSFILIQWRSDVGELSKD